MKKPDSITGQNLVDILNQQSKKGGFRKIEESPQDSCNSPSHNPPSHIYLSGGLYEYTCPSCGHVTIVRVPKITM